MKYMNDALITLNKGNKIDETEQVKQRSECA